MKEPFSPTLFISADQKYEYRMTHPYFLAIDERIVGEQWPSRNLHWHDYFEIEIVLGGTATHLYNGSRSPLFKGCAYLLTPMDIHALIPDPDTSFHLIHLRFDENAITEEVRQLLLQHEHTCFVAFDNEIFDRLLVQLADLLKCFETPSAFHHLSRRLMLSLFCLQILQQSPAGVDRFPVYETANPIVRKSMLYIFYNFRKKITMQQLGRQAHVSPNHLALLFKQTIGITCMQLVADLRMQYALKLLENPDLNVQTVSEESGFSSVSYFISTFRQQFGCTPKEYTKHKNN